MIKKRRQFTPEFKPQVVLVLLTGEKGLMEEMETLVKNHRQSRVDTIIVSNEVGLGLVPPYELGRAYRDMLGRANQYLASQADEVYFLVAWIPMKVK